jgi:hypothetical protein
MEVVCFVISITDLNRPALERMMVVVVVVNGE